MGYSEWLESSELEWILKWITEELGFLKSQIEDSANGTNNQTDKQEDTTPAENTNMMESHLAAHNTERTNGIISKVWLKKTSWEIAIWWVVSNITWWVTRGEKMARWVEEAEIEGSIIINQTTKKAQYLAMKTSRLNKNEIKDAQTYINFLKDFLRINPYISPIIEKLKKRINEASEAPIMTWSAISERGSQTKGNWFNEHTKEGEKKTPEAEDMININNTLASARELYSKNTPLSDSEIQEALSYIEILLNEWTSSNNPEYFASAESLQKRINREKWGGEEPEPADNYDIDGFNKAITLNFYGFLFWWDYVAAREALEKKSLSLWFEDEYDWYIDFLKSKTEKYDTKKPFTPEEWDSIIITKLLCDEINTHWKYDIKKININGINIEDNDPVTNYIKNLWLADKIKNNNGIIHLDDLDDETKSYVLGKVWLKCVDDLMSTLRNKVEELKYVKDETEFKNKLTKILKENQKINSILSSEPFKYYFDGKDNIKILASFLICLWCNIPIGWADLEMLNNLSKKTSKTYKHSRDITERINQWKLERNKWIKWTNTHIVVEDEPTIWYTDLQTASWADIARNAWLWEDLKKYDINKNIEVSDEHMKHIQQEAFPTAWHNFIENNDDISGYIDDLDMKLIYNFDNNSINESKRKILSERLKGEFWDGIDLDKIHSRLSWFLTEMDNVKNQLTEDHILENWIVYENTKLDAIGWVIDSIKNIFDKMWEEMKFWQLCEGFKYDEREPLKIEWDKLVIKGLLNGTKTKMCYDLKNWDLYMNSFIKESVNPAMITVGDRWNEWEDYPEADVKIWSINSFEDILSDIDISEECDVENEWDIHLNDDPHPDNINRPNIPGPRNINKWWSINNVTSRPGLKGNGNDTNDNYPKRSKNSQYTTHMTKEKPVWRQIKSPSWAPRYLQWRSQKLEGPVPFEQRGSIEETIKINAKINNAIDLIWEEVRRHTEKQSQKNDVIIKFMKTFNIVSDQWTIKSMQFHEGSNIYNLLHIIENSDSNQLSKFSSFMNDISKYAGLTRWNNNPPEIQNNRMLKEIKESNQDDNNSARWCLKKSLMSFKGESVNIRNQNVLNFESNNRLWIAQLIIDNIITNPKDVANSKFETIKIDSFLRSLNTGYWINGYVDDNPDDILNQLDNV